MATTRKILKKIRVGNTTYKAGDEESLAKVLLPEQVAAAADNHIIEGDWGQEKEQSRPSKPSAKAE